MAFFLHIVSDSAPFFSFRSTSLSFSGILGSSSRNLSCSHKIWPCFLVSQPRCAIRGQGEVLVGKHAQVPARLMVVRVPEEVIAQRQERIRKAGQTQGKSGQSKSVESSEMDHFDY